MPAYHYLAVDNAGHEKKGVIEAETEQQARQILRGQSLFPLNIKLAKHHEKLAANATLFSWLKRYPKMSSKDLALLTRQLATLFSAGLPVEEALLAAAEQTEKSNTKGIVLSVRSKVMEGYALAAALKEYPQAFSSLFCATIAAGEQSGHLDKVLQRLTDYTEQQWTMQQKLKTALIYPIMIILVAVGIVGFLLAYVVPKMIAVYSHLNQSLPLATEILLAVSDAIKNYGLYGAGVIVLVIYSIRRWLAASEKMREKFHTMLLRCPGINQAIKMADTSRFLRTLSILSASGVPVVDGMTIASQLVTTIPIQKAVKEAVDRVREGAAINLALKQTTYFSPMAIHMVASGEASGQLEVMLERVAQYQEENITRWIEVTLALFEPAIILIMGAIVLFIVLAVMLPIFNLNQISM